MHPVEGSVYSFRSQVWLVLNAPFVVNSTCRHGLPCHQGKPFSFGLKPLKILLAQQRKEAAAQKQSGHPRTLIVCAKRWDEVRENPRDGTAQNLVSAIDQ
ncbi:hypothetical protein J6590_015469 [Homalodisca vitripennis]|nr:hypothetical protein J6590_015469 [Homalodisca vitripennis]